MEQEHTKKEQFVYVLYALFIACLFLFIRGYQFNTDDQAEHLPQVYQLMDHGLYQHDYFVTEYHKTYSLRMFYVGLVYGLSFLFPVSIICFVGTIACITLSVYSFMQISTFYSHHKLISFVSPILIFIVFYKYTIGGNYITDSSFICSTIALSLAAYGLLLMHRRKYYLMAVVIGIATLFQVMDAAQPFFLIVLFMVTQYNRIGIKKIAITILLYLLFAGAMLFPMIYHQFFIHYDHDPNLYADILFFFRNPNHFVPSSFSMRDYVCFSILFFIGVILLVEKVRSNYRWFAFFIGGVIVLGCIVYFLLFEIFHQFWIAKTQWFKSTMWLEAMASIFVASFLTNWIVRQINYDKALSMLRTISLIGIIALLFVMMNSAILPIQKLQGRYCIGNYKKSDLTKIHEWIASNTDKDVTILTAPTDFSFACEAKRSMPIGYKAIIHEPFFLLPWYKNYRDIYSTALVTLNGKDALSVSDTNYNTVLYKPKNPPVKIDYRLDDITKCHFVEALGTEIHREGNYILTKFE